MRVHGVRIGELKNVLTASPGLFIFAQILKPASLLLRCLSYVACMAVR